MTNFLINQAFPESAWVIPGYGSLGGLGPQLIFSLVSFCDCQSHTLGGVFIFALIKKDFKFGVMRVPEPLRGRYGGRIHTFPVRGKT